MSKIKIFALGGLNENGKNMYVVEVNKDIFVFDAGLKYDNDINLGIDYSYVLILSVPIIILYEVLDYFQRKKIHKSDKIFVNIVRYLLPVITAVLFFVCTIVFYFLWNDFQILSITI